jgi:hypothetical protein
LTDLISGRILDFGFWILDCDNTTEQFGFSILDCKGGCAVRLRAPVQWGAGDLSKRTGENHEEL